MGYSLRMMPDGTVRTVYEKDKEENKMNEKKTKDLFDEDEKDVLLSATREKISLIENKILELEKEKEKCQKIIQKITQGE